MGGDSDSGAGADNVGRIGHRLVGIEPIEFTRADNIRAGAAIQAGRRHAEPAAGEGGGRQRAASGRIERGGGQDEAVGDRLHRTAAQIKADDAKQLADLQNNVTGQLATKASTDDVNKIGTDVDSVKTDLDATKSNLEMAKGEFGTLIAKNHDQIEELRRMGERDYYEFTITQKGQRTKVGDLMVELRSVNPKRNVYSVAVYVNDQRFDKNNRSVDEPIYFFPTGTGHSAPYEFTVNQVGKNKITGYLSVPKSGPAQAADNSGM